MNTYISLLRGINVGGSKPVSMETLREIYAGLGFSHVRTYLQSGNVVFAAPQSDQAQMAGQIEASIEQRCGFKVEVFIREPSDFQSIIAHNPFLQQRDVDTSKLHVSFLYRAIDEAKWGKLAIPNPIPDQLARGESVIYLYYPNGYSRSKISTSYLEKALGAPLTNRNWNTVNAVYKLAMAP